LGGCERCEKLRVVKGAPFPWSVSGVLSHETKEFLKGVVPFNLLPEVELDEILNEITLDYFPKGTTILHQDGAPAESLYVIKRGGVCVSVSAQKEQELVIDYRSEGDYFGFLSLVTGDRPRASVKTIEDTIGYVLQKEPFLLVLERNPKVNEYLLKSYFTHFIDRTHEETRKKFARATQGDRVLFETPVGHIVRRTAITATEDLSIRRAARRMTERGISSLVIVDGDGKPVGIVTDRDLREKVVAEGGDHGRPVGTVMSSPVIGIDAGEPCLEALLRMMQYRIHHLLVVHEGALPGMVTSHDFMLLQGSLPTVLVRDVSRMQNLEQLPDTAERLTRAVSNLLRNGAEAVQVTDFVTVMMQTLLGRVIELLEADLGSSPRPYSLFLIGHGGRRELLLDRSPALAVAFTGADDAGRHRETLEYLEELRKRLVEATASCRLAVGHAVLAPEDIRSVEEWRESFAGWATNPDQEEMRADFLDMRSIRGDERLVDDLRIRLLESLPSSGRLIASVALRTLENKPPMGFFKEFLVENSGEQSAEFDLEAKMVKPLVEFVRLSAAEHGIRSRSTKARIRALEKKAAIREGEHISQALDYLLELLLHHQLEQLRGGRRPDCSIDPGSLSHIERKTLKDVFQLITRLHENLQRRYQVEANGP
jgi:CBS domain-containing protein